ncbi:MAG: amidohydrolase family protein [Anaerolineales bacterium]|nr:amidohydrolase family protein [Anaerolineales bacterium]
MLNFFDAYCALGHMSAPVFGQEFATAAALSAALSEAHISEALVYSPAAYEYDPSVGNQMLQADLADHPNMHPCWVLLPPATGEMPPLPQLLSLMQQQNVRAVRLCPSPARNNFSLAAWSAGPLLQALAEAAVPLFLDLSEVTWSEVAALLSDYATLPLVLTGVTYRLDRYLYPLWSQHQNLYVDTSGYQGFYAIEAVVTRFGSERLLFGTNMPVYSPGAAIAAVTYADISDGAKSLIAGGNLRRLLEAAYAG